VLFFVAVFIVVVYADTLREAVPLFGLGPELLLLAAAGILFAGARWIRKLRVAQLKRRATFNQPIRLTQDEGGLRFSTDEIEHCLKWKGISQMILEKDGVAVSHGALFFLVPDSAFASAAERLAFISDVYARLDAEAQSNSRKHIRPAIEQGEQSASR
jgi:hypothetical protein